MYRNGQLTEESNPLWYLEFKGYHGLQCINDLPYFTLGNVGVKGNASKYCTKKQIANVKSLISELTPLIRDSVTFYLLTMAMMLDTSNLKVAWSRLDDESPQYTLVPVNIDDSRQKMDELRLHDVPVAPNVSTTSAEDSQNILLSNGCSDDTHRQQSNKRKRNIHERFKEIDNLRDIYLHLLKSRCKASSLSEIRKFGDSNEQGNRAISSMKKIATFMAIIMKIYENRD